MGIHEAGQEGGGAKVDAAFSLALTEKFSNGAHRVDTAIPNLHSTIAQCGGADRQNPVCCNEQVFTHAQEHKTVRPAAGKRKYPGSRESPRRIPAAGAVIPAVFEFSFSKCNR